MKIPDEDIDFELLAAELEFYSPVGSAVPDELAEEQREQFVDRHITAGRKADPQATTALADDAAPTSFCHHGVSWVMGT